MIKEVFAQPVSIGENYAFGGIKSFGEGLGYLVNPAFSLAGILLIIWFLWGTFDILVSGGDKEKVAAGRNKITHVIIGFMLLILMFLVLQFIPRFFGLKGFELF
jgi:hypothetical protein